MCLHGLLGLVWVLPAIGFIELEILQLTNIIASRGDATAKGHSGRPLCLNPRPVRIEMDHSFLETGLHFSGFVPVA